MSTDSPVQALVRDEDGNLWMTIEEPWEGRQEAMRVNLENQGAAIGTRGYLETNSFQRYRRVISDASDAISELSMSIQYGSELSQDMVQKHSIDFMPHQLRPLALFEGAAEREGILIADEVGIGKTYSAGLILHNGLMDGKIRRALVVCPKSIENKWHSTLSREFRIKCSKANSGRRLMDWLEGNTNGIDVLVTSFDKARAQDDDGTMMIDKLEGMLGENRIREIDLVIFDEVHRVIGRTEGMLRRRLAQVVSLSSLSRVGLTATPVWRDAGDIGEISQILRPSAMSNSDADAMISLQSRFTVAVNALKLEKPSNDDLQRALSGLSGIDLGFLQSDIDDVTKMNPSQRTELALRIGEISPFSSWITRTRAEEVGSLASRYVPDADLVDLDDTPGEQFFDPTTGTLQTMESEREMVEEIAEMLEHMPHLLQLSSSPRSFHKHLPDLLREGKISESSADRARMLANRLSNSPLGSKESRLIEILNQITSNPERRGAVIFTNWQPTFDRLTSDSLNLGGAVPGNRRIRMYQASYSDEERRERQVRAFRNHDDPETFPLLVATSIMQEGIDLQDSADCVIHYDLPSNPQAVEQRIGRVDRMKQASKTVEVRYVILRGFADHDFLLGMDDRIAEFEENVGSMRPLLPSGIGSSSGSGSITDEMRAKIEEWNLERIADLDLTGFRESSIPDGISRKVPNEISELSRDVFLHTLRKSLPPESVDSQEDAIIIDTNGNQLAMDPIIKSSTNPARIWEELLGAADRENKIWALRTNHDGLPKYNHLRRAILTTSIHSQPKKGPTPVVITESLASEAIEFHELVCEHDHGSSIRWIAIIYRGDGPEEARISDVTENLIEASKRGKLSLGTDFLASPLSSSILDRNEKEIRSSLVVWERQRMMSKSRRKFAIASRLESEGATQNEVEGLRQQARELRKNAEGLDNRQHQPIGPSLRLLLVRD